MAWNIEELETKLKMLEKRVLEVEDENTRFTLMVDIQNIKCMINYKLGESKYPQEIVPMYIFDKEYLLSQNEALRKYGKDYLMCMRRLAPLHHVPSKTLFPKHIPYSEFENLLYEFLKYFDGNLLTLYQKYQTENRIEINKLPYEKKSCRGQCLPIIHEESTYISSRYNNTMGMITNIPHELGHAIQFEGDKDFRVTQNKLFSLFGESYSLFVEYAFIDFLKNTKYQKHAWACEAELINNFLCLIDYYLPAFDNIPSVLFSEDGILKMNGYLLHSFNCNDILSHMLAMYWYNLYLENQELAKAKANEFNEKFGNIYDEQFMQEYNAKKLSRSVERTIHRYFSYYNKKNK